mmetsp:Transcript_9702/g.25104  ORF Transcript_9702/g.25104 Transcript_9702/m.25104 type:complete len:219 (-) Transcript_9702:151-807(-)
MSIVLDSRPLARPVMVWRGKDGGTLFKGTEIHPRLVCWCKDKVKGAAEKVELATIDAVTLEGRFMRAVEVQDMVLMGEHAHTDHIIVLARELQAAVALDRFRDAVHAGAATRLDPPTYAVARRDHELAAGIGVVVHHKPKLGIDDEVHIPGQACSSRGAKRATGALREVERKRSRCHRKGLQCDAVACAATNGHDAIDRGMMLDARHMTSVAPSKRRA